MASEFLKISNPMCSMLRGNILISFFFYKQIVSQQYVSFELMRSVFVILSGRHRLMGAIVVPDKVEQNWK